jgi:hypothetical protein
MAALLTKKVHFSNQIKVRLFRPDTPLSIDDHSSELKELQSESEALGSDTSPHAFQWEISATNISSVYGEDMVQLTSLNLSRDSLVGTVDVANLAFEKAVSARYTFNHWQNISETTAEYRHPSKDGLDHFEFVIKLDKVERRDVALLFCIQYCVNGQQYWDNNFGRDYLVDLSRKEQKNTFYSNRYSLYKATPQRPKRFSHHSTLPRGTCDIHSEAYRHLIRNFCYFESRDKIGRRHTCADGKQSSLVHVVGILQPVSA